MLDKHRRSNIFGKISLMSWFNIVYNEKVFFFYIRIIIMIILHLKINDTYSSNYYTNVYIVPHHFFIEVLLKYITIKLTCSYVYCLLPASSTLNNSLKCPRPCLMWVVVCTYFTVCALQKVTLKIWYACFIDTCY